MNPADVLIDTVMLLPDGHYYARVLEPGGEPTWRKLPEHVAQGLIGELEAAMEQLREDVGDRGRG